ncbi:MAG TPA: MBL fold metallo-hydrolase [Candidatus Angelobacter sp.]|jgi:beta-lactamase superfamily II metal-dependent hydrolase|nr:MBL fold metallo-hydrolase [Candidatus Angelobacter sp.]
METSLYLHVYRVDEGLGNACLLEFPDETCAIVDWGTQRQDALERVLTIAKKEKLRFVAATHAHADHTLGLPKLLRECKKRGIQVGRFVYPASTLHRENAYLTEARIAAMECGIAMSSVSLDRFAPPGQQKPPYLAWAEDYSWEVRVLSPALTQIGTAEIKALKGRVVPGNETSLVVLFHFLAPSKIKGAGRVLLPGDATPPTLNLARQTGQDFPDLAIDNQAFVVPHHGSQYNFPEWLKTYIHGIAVVSAPTDSLTHPSKEVLEHLGTWTYSSPSSKLFCTSYAKCCAKKFGATASASDQFLVKPGSCFGDIVICVPKSSTAHFDQSSHSGHSRRQFGYCGNVAKTFKT